MMEKRLINLQEKNAAKGRAIFKLQELCAMRGSEILDLKARLEVVEKLQEEHGINVLF